MYRWGSFNLAKRLQWIYIIFSQKNYHYLFFADSSICIALFSSFYLYICTEIKFIEKEIRRFEKCYFTGSMIEQCWRGWRKMHRFWDGSSRVLDNINREEDEAASPSSSLNVEIRNTAICRMYVGDFEREKEKEKERKSSMEDCLNRNKRNKKPAQKMRLHRHRHRHRHR